MPWFQRWYPKFSTLPRAPTHVVTTVIHTSQNQGTIIWQTQKRRLWWRRSRRRIFCSGMLVCGGGWGREGYWAPSSSSHTHTVVSCIRGQDISCIIYGHRDTLAHNAWEMVWADIGAKIWTMFRWRVRAFEPLCGGVLVCDPEWDHKLGNLWTIECDFGTHFDVPWWFLRPAWECGVLSLFRGFFGLKFLEDCVESFFCVSRNG